MKILLHPQKFEHMNRKRGEDIRFGGAISFVRDGLLNLKFSLATQLDLKNTANIPEKKLCRVEEGASTVAPKRW